MTTPKIVPCEGCGQPIFFVISPSGARLPLDASSVVYELTGNDLDGYPTARKRVGHDGKTRVAWVSHFRTCSHARDFSGRGAKPHPSAREGQCPPSRSTPAS